jgi:hypothetical protein
MLQTPNIIYVEYRNSVRYIFPVSYFFKRSLSINVSEELLTGGHSCPFACVPRVIGEKIVPFQKYLFGWYRNLISQIVTVNWLTYKYYKYCNIII